MSDRVLGPPLRHDLTKAPVLVEIDGARTDPHSYARPSEARVVHVSLDLFVDFETRQLTGHARLRLDVAPGAAQVVLDTRDLVIRSVQDDHGRDLPFVLGESDPIRGQALSIDLAGSADLVIAYATRPEAPALQWLEAEQTTEGAAPFLYSQGHALLTRSWIPTQDSPAVRQTFDARIQVPADLTAVMSGHSLEIPDDSHGPFRTFAFHQGHPIPAYLLALAVGKIGFRSLGPRTGVYAEPARLDHAHAEFADLERMLDAAEALLGPYRWGRLDALVMPPSFPFGGMENPCLMFISPSILAGDRSLTSLLGHELAHAWSGNLVTNATWDDFWLNEGFTVYAELRIVEALYGRFRAEMLEVYGRRELLAEIERRGAGSHDTCLKLNLAGRDPLEGVTVTPYVKGATLLHAIERVVGRDRFDNYLRSWFERRAFTSVTTEEFLADVRRHLLQGEPGVESALDLERWVYAPGLPDNAPAVSSPRLTAVDVQVAAFVTGQAAAALDVQGWTTQEWRHFLNALPRGLAEARLADLEHTFALSARRNAEVLFAWLRLAVGHLYRPVTEALENFLIDQGRRKFVEPLYRELMDSEWGRSLATQIYQRARPRYHATTRATIDPIVHPPDAGAASGR
ncbi:MAG: M1 family metallopeptidase [Vicinamibacterales bacterium]